MRHKRGMLVLIDNYDSFTYNLVQYFGDLGQDVDVYRNDKISVEDILSMKPAGIIVSPGPSDPDHAGICLKLVERAANENIPVLGVCLGHQTIGQAFGGQVVRAPSPVHGKVWDIRHTGKGVFEGLPSPLQATRYHSLIVDRDTLPDDLIITAETEDGLIMGLQHKDKPVHGIQFHPESIETIHGHDMLKNFIEHL